MLNILRSDLKSYWLRWLFAAITVTFGLQELRVLFVSFVGYLRDSTGMSSLSLAPVAIAVFALAFLVGPLNRLLGTRSTLWLSAGGLAALRILEQIAQSATLDLYLSAAATALFLMWIPLAVGIARARGGEIPTHLGLGWLLGLTLDSALQIGYGTLDLSWQPGLLTLVLVLALAALQLWTLSKLAADAPPAADGNWASSAALLGIGPWLLMQLLVFQNTAMFSSHTGWSTPLSGTLLLAGNAFGLWQAVQVASSPRKTLAMLLSGILVFASLLLTYQMVAGQAIVMLLGQVFSLVLGYGLIQAAAGSTQGAGLLRSTLFNGLGSIFFVLMTFVYYASYDIDFGIRSNVLAPAAAVLTTLFLLIGLRGAAERKPSRPLLSPAMLAAATLVVPLVLSFAWKMPSAQAVESNTVRIINYNLHDAVNTDGRVDPEALARVIEDSGADIVAVQEISRGWLIWGGLDMLEWLAQRLDMQYIWGPTADTQWGNAIFTRLPIQSYTNNPLPPEEVLLLRGYIYAELDVNGQTVTLIDTHFSEKAGQDDIRAQQASVLVDVAGGRPATVVVGDLNSLPDSLALEVMLNGGFVDISRESGVANTFTYPSFAADHQIDYIFISPDLRYSDFSIPLTSASDHLPLVATITLP